MKNQKLNNLLKDPRNNWRRLLIVVILTFLVGAGILAWQYFWLPRQEVEMPKIEIPEKKVEDETADWKIFTNGNYHYSIKYPDDWPTVSSVSVGQMSPGVGLHAPELVGRIVLLSKNLPTSELPTLQIEIVEVSQGIPPGYSNEEEYIEAFKDGCTRNELISKRLINGSEMVIGHSISPYEPGDPYVVGHLYCAVIYHEGLLYDMYWHEGSFEDSGLFNQILSTFRFLE